MINTAPAGCAENQKQVVTYLRCTAKLTPHSSCRKWGHRFSPSRTEALRGEKKKEKKKQQSEAAAVNELTAAYRLSETGDVKVRKKVRQKKGLLITSCHSFSVSLKEKVVKNAKN